MLVLLIMGQRRSYGTGTFSFTSGWREIYDPPPPPPPPLKLSNVTGQKNLALQVPLVVRYKTLEKFSKALYGTTEGTCSARFFRPVMDRGEIISNLG